MSQSQKGPTFHVNIRKLRELKFLSKSDEVLHVTEGPWTRDGMYYVSIVTIKLANDEGKEFVLKCPWDLTRELISKDSSPSGKSSLVSQYVNLQVRWGRELKRIGVPSARVEKYDEGTLVQENLKGTDFYTYLAKVDKIRGDAIMSKRDDILLRIKSRLSLVPVNRIYGSSGGMAAARDFLVSRDGDLVLVNFDFTRHAPRK
jgi:hypothetical protein